MGMFYTVLCALFASFGAFIFGYDSGVVASTLTMDRFLEHFNSPSPALVGAFVSVFPGGCFFGAALAGWLGDKWGRKRTIQFGAFVGVIGTSLQTGGYNYAMLLVGRVIAGFSVGILSMIAPLYQAEIAPPKHRGFIVGLAQQMIGFGFITANWVGYGSQYLKTNAQWRLPLGIQIVPAFLLAVGGFLLPFSPRWLIEQGREDEAYKVVRNLHFSGANEEWVQAEFNQMVTQIRLEKQSSSRNIRELWSTGPMIYRTLVACGIQIMGQNTGINVIKYYGPKMYAALGVAGNKLLLVNSIYGVIGPITNFFFITFALDRVGRVRPLWMGSIGIGIALMVVTIINAQVPPDGPDPNKDAQKLGIAMFFLTSIIFSVSYGPISWTYVSEVFPMRTRSMGNAAATCSNWIFNVIWAQAAPPALNSVQWRFYILYVVLNFVSGLLVFFFFPETVGKSLEEINEVFGDQKIDHNLQVDALPIDGDSEKIPYSGSHEKVATKENLPAHSDKAQ